MKPNEWPKIRDVMLPYDGGASQIHVLDLPKAKLEHVISTIESQAINSKITVLSGNVLEESIPLSTWLKKKGDIPSAGNIQTTVVCEMFGGSDFTFDIWGQIGEFFELEIWFWADQVFGDDDNLNYQLFKSVLTFIKALTITGEYVAVLTPNEASDPRKDLESGIGVLLAIKCV